MKLGRRAAYLRRCLKAQELLSQFDTATSVRRRIFDIRIQPELGCSYATFNNMLNEPNPRRQLDEIELKLSNI
ncbi:MAG: hypothetical protein LBB85_11720 [Dysgonamonadaceae bacterium]|nr:hypothetical protein [Dysgonamonadaceae bacterium]